MSETPKFEVLGKLGAAGKGAWAEVMRRPNDQAALRRFLVTVANNKSSEPDELTLRLIDG